jgi:phosphoglycerate dehydrogenase-like enzyme
MARYMGFKVIYSNRHQAEQEDFEFVSRGELYQRADVVLLLTPLTEETRGMVNKESISQMKDDVIIVNVCE